MVILAVGGAIGFSARDGAAQDCTSGPFVHGVDVADGQGAIDWTSVAGAGVSFAYMKASQGTYDTDTTFSANWTDSKAAGVLRGAYHFLDPTLSGSDQATYYLNIVGTLDADDLPPMLDIECPTSNNEPNSMDCLGTGSSGDATGAAITQVMNDWLTTVKVATGRTPLVYSFGSYFSDDAVDTTGLENYPLFIAYPTTLGCFDFPGPWAAATFWQYSWTGSVAGISGGVDLDYFLGTAADLTNFIVSGTSPDGGAGIPCVVTTSGESGICISTTDCATMPNHVATPGYCPGPDDIQCCTSTGQGMDQDGGVQAGDSGPMGMVDAGHGSGTGNDGGEGAYGSLPESGAPGAGCACTSASGERATGSAFAVAALALCGAARRRKTRARPR